MRTPLIYDKALWETSGHWEKFREHMFTVESEGREFGLKPMNCPGHCCSTPTAPERIASCRFGWPRRVLHRDELAGTLHGLLRVRHVTQDDAHIFCTPEQIEDEIFGCLEFGYAIYDRLGIEIRVELDPAREQARHRRGVGLHRGRARARRSSAAGSSTRSTRATARSTARRSICT